jgi:hypothetical protein
MLNERTKEGIEGLAVVGIWLFSIGLGLSSLDGVCVVKSGNSADFVLGCYVFIGSTALAGFAHRVWSQKGQQR